jgi:hypothetical protein
MGTDTFLDDCDWLEVGQVDGERSAIPDATLRWKLEPPAEGAWALTFRVVVPAEAAKGGER